MSRLSGLRERIEPYWTDPRKRRRAYALLAVLLAILCLFPQPHVGRAKIVPQETSSALAGLGGGGGRMQDIAAMFGGGRRAIDLYLTIGQSEDVRSDVIRELKLVGSSWKYRSADAARVRLENSVDVQSLPGGVVEIKVTTHDPGESLRLTRAYAQAIATRFKVLNGEQLTTKRKLVDGRFREATTRLAQAQTKLDSFRRANRLSATPEAELGAALTVRAGIEAQLQAKLVEQETLERFMGPENPRLLAAQAEVRELRGRLSRSVAPGSDGGGPNAGELTALNSEYMNLYRDYIFAQTVYQIYSRISEEVAVDELSGRTASTIQTIEAPHVDAGRHYNVPAVGALALLVLLALFTEIYAPATGIALWRREERAARP